MLMIKVHSNDGYYFTVININIISITITREGARGSSKHAGMQERLAASKIKNKKKEFQNRGHGSVRDYYTIEAL